MFPFWLIPIWVFNFVLYGILNAIVAALGLIMIPLAVAFNAYEAKPSPLFDHQIIKCWTWKIMAPWQNYEDGIVAGFEYLDKPEWFRIIYWSAIRNPSNGLRWVKWMNPIPELDKVKFIASFGSNKDNWTYEELYNKEEHGTFWYLCWYKYWANIRIQFFITKNTQIRIWIGAKIYPSNMFKLPYYQKYGAATTFQLRTLDKENQ